MSPETTRAVRNAVVLGASLILTWTVALGIRLLLPRVLGPTVFGEVHFADFFTMGFFAATTLGVDTYIGKEVPTRPEHASEFFGGVLLTRILASFLLLGVMAVTLRWMGRPEHVRELVYWFAAAHLFRTLNLSYAALLQAVGQVTGLARANVASKVVWGAGIAGGLALGLSVTVIPITYAIAEAGKMAVLALLARRHLGLRYRIALRPTAMVVATSMPFYLNLLAHTLYEKIDVSMIAALTTDAEAGWYGAAGNLTAIALLLTPLITAVVLPHSSQAKAKSPEELQRVMGGTLRVTLTITVPISLILFLGADVWAVFLFGEPFAPTALSLRPLAVTFVFTYIATLSAIHLFQLERSWLVTAISFVVLALNPAANYFLIAEGPRWFGDGGGGMVAGLTTLATEVVAVLLMQLAAGRRSIMAPLTPMFLRITLVCALVAGLHLLLEPLGAWRIAADVVAYLALAPLLGAVHRDDAQAAAAMIRNRFKHESEGGDET